MKIAITVLILALVSVAIAEVGRTATTPKPVDILIGKVSVAYEKAVTDADVAYAKSVAPALKRYGAYRDKAILRAGTSAIKRLTAARRGASELDGIKMEQETERIRVSLDEKVGSVSKVTPKVVTKVSVLAACGSKFQGHTYLAIISKSWVDAKKKCEAMGGHLAYIETDAEMAWIKQSFGGSGRLWLGAAVDNGKLKWLNGKAVNPSFLRRGFAGNAKTFGRLDGESISSEGPNDKGTIGFICEWE